MNFRTSKRARVRALTAITGVAAAVIAMVTAPPTGAAPPTEPVACPKVYPVTQLTKDQPVNGFTVSTGTSRRSSPARYSASLTTASRPAST
jgi:hypothetical protein